MYILLTSIIISLVSFTPTKSNFDTFLHFVGKNLHLSETVKRNCTWQYAIVKVRTDNHNTITSYQIENKVDNNLIKCFSFLKGYKFDKNKPVNNHSTVFFVSLENQRIDNCDIQKTTGYKHEEPTKIFNLYKLHQHNKVHRNLYIDKIITQVIYEPVK